MENIAVTNDQKNLELENLVQVQNNQLVVSSRQIAEHSGKQHNHVLRGICTGIWYDQIWTDI